MYNYLEEYGLKDRQSGYFFRDDFEEFGILQDYEETDIFEVTKIETLDETVSGCRIYRIIISDKEEFILKDIESVWINENGCLESGNYIQNKNNMLSFKCKDDGEGACFHWASCLLLDGMPAYTHSVEEREQIQRENIFTGKFTLYTTGANFDKETRGIECLRFEENKR